MIRVVQMALLEHYLTHIQTKKQQISVQEKGVIAFLASLDYLEEKAPSIQRSILQELQAQRRHLKLIASENFSSLASQLAMGNLLTDKYAEGFPSHRFYAGCENVDALEKEAADLLKEIFGCDHAFVQPPSGADANLLAFWTILVKKIEHPSIEKLGKKNLNELNQSEYEELRCLLSSQRILGMSLDAGGHLTHGYRQNISGKMFQSFGYGVDPKTHLVDYDALLAQAKQVRPLILIAGYSAYPRRLNFARMRAIADEVGAVLMVDMAHFAGLVAGKVMQGEENPIPYADIVTSTTHKTLRGPRGGFLLCKKEFEETVNKACPLMMGGPLPHVMAAKAVAFKEACTLDFQHYAKQIVDNARALAQELNQRGAKLITGGTDNHMIVMDVTPFGINGRQAESLLQECGIMVNRNAIPFDTNGPWYTSGIRIGTPAITTLGMGKTEMQTIAHMITSLLSHASREEGSKVKAKVPDTVCTQVREQLKELLTAYPLYPEIILGPQA